MPLHPNTHQCTHVKADGLRCGSPALRGQKFCYFHHHSADHRPRTQARVVQIPFPENAAAIQVAIHNVMLAIIDRRIDERRASQLLWALQIAAGQGRQLPFDNNLLMSRTVTQLPDYELAEQQSAEEDQRLLDEYRKQTTRRAAAPASDRSMTESPDGPITQSPDHPINSSDRAIVRSSDETSVIPSGAALRGEVEGPAFPAHQQSAERETTRSKRETRNLDFEKETRRALAGDWRATDRLFRAAGLIAPKTAT